MDLSQTAYRILFSIALQFSCGAMAYASGIPSGKLYRIGVDHTGIFQITPRQLQSMGFDSANDVAVYGSGGVEGNIFDLNDGTTDRLPEIPTMVTDDGRLIFYGEGSERYKIHTNSSAVYYYADIECNPNTTAGYYFVGPKNDARHIVTIHTGYTDGTILTTHNSVAVYHPQTTNPARAGVFFAGDDFSKTTDKKFINTFKTPDCATSGSIGLRLRAGLKSSQPRININILNSTRTLYTISRKDIYDDIEAYFNATDFMELPCIMPGNLPDEMPFKANLLNAGNVAYAAFESVTLTYTRNNIMPADGRQLSMFYNNLKKGDALTLDTNGNTICLWDVTDGVNPVAMEITVTDNTAQAVLPVTHSGSCNFIAFNPTDGLGAVTLDGEATMNRLADIAVPDMVILTAPGHRAQAERLASLHKEIQGLEVAVVEPMEIFNEFGSGSQSPYAIRRFMKSLYDRNPSKLKHLLIMGSSTYDPCGRTTGLSLNDTHVITYQVEDYYKQGDASTCYCSDAFYGMLGDNDITSDIMAAGMSVNVGRIPCANTAQAIAYVDKAERYLTSPPAADTYSRALIIGDHGDSNGHLKQALEVCDSIEYLWAPHATVTRAMSALFPKSTGKISPQTDKIRNTLNSGIGYFSYSGHGNPQTIGSGILLNNATAGSYTNTCYPFMMLATCYATGYDRNENSIGETFLLNDKGGAIAVVGSGRSVQMSLNQYINMAVAKEYFTAVGTACTGDVYRAARNNVISRNSNEELTTNTACYNMLGDPALPLYSHTHSIGLDHTSDITITPLSHNMVSGSITKADGTIDDSFNGKVIMNLYAPVHEKMTEYDRNGCTPIPVKYRDKLLATVTGTVTGGVFKTQFDCPAVAEPGHGHRLTIHAVADNGNERAIAAFHNVNVTETPPEPELDDHNAPVINELWVNSPDFNDGDIVPPGITVNASIIPSKAGLSMTRTIDRTIYLSVDGCHYNDVASRLTFDSDGTASLCYPVKRLSDGPHTVTLSAVDNAGNRSCRSVKFLVIDRPEDITIEVSDKAVTNAAEISLTHPFGIEPSSRLVIQDAAGNTVFTVADAVFPYTWNLTDFDGNPVADGRYTIRAMVKNGLMHAATPPVSITIINETNNR